MCINLSITSQSAMFFESLKSKAWDKLYDFSKENPNITQSIGLFMVIGCILLDLVEIVSTVGEKIIKGLANIFGAMISDKCSFSRGVKQIFIQLPFYLIVSALAIGIQTPFKALFVTMCIFEDPEGMCRAMSQSYKSRVIQLNGIPNNTLPDDATERMRKGFNNMKLLYA